MVKFWFVDRQLFTSLTYQTSGSSETKKSCKKYILLSQPTDLRDNESDRFKVVICINRLRVHDATIQWTYVSSLQALTSFSNFADTRNIVVVKQGRVTSPVITSSYFCTERFMKTKRRVLIIAAEKNCFTL